MVSSGSVSESLFTRVHAPLCETPAMPWASSKMIKGCDAEAACRELSEYYDIIRHESGSGIAGTTIELVPKGFNKAVGISAVC